MLYKTVGFGKFKTHLCKKKKLCNHVMRCMTLVTI